MEFVKYVINIFLINERTATAAPATTAKTTTTGTTTQPQAIRAATGTTTLELTFLSLSP